MSNRFINIIKLRKAWLIKQGEAPTQTSMAVEYILMASGYAENVAVKSLYGFVARDIARSVEIITLGDLNG